MKIRTAWRSSGTCQTLPISCLYLRDIPFLLSSPSPLKTLKPCFSLAPRNPNFHYLQTQPNPVTESVYSLISSTGSPPNLSYLLSMRRSNNIYPICCNGLLRPQSFSRMLYVPCGSDEVESIVRPKRVSEVVEIIRKDDRFVPEKLGQIGFSNLYHLSQCEIFRTLNRERVCGLKLFHFIGHPNGQFQPFWDTDICSLIIDNCGRLENYDTMGCLLWQFQNDSLCVNENAFKFLLNLEDSSEACVKKSTQRVVDMLKDVGGSSGGSGIWSLIKMFSTAEWYEMAKFVIGITWRRVSYYNVLFVERCRNGHFEKALALLEEMRHLGFEPNIKTYNLLLSSLCRNERLAEACSLLEEIQSRAIQPNVLTFEVFIYYSFKHGKMDSAVQFLDRMESLGLKPRFTTHADIIRGYFKLGQYEEAYKYVNDAGDKYKLSSAMNYILLASLHENEKHPNVARRILIEMMNKGLRPKFGVFLHKRCSREWFLVTYLEGRFSRLRSTVEDVYRIKP